MYNINNIHFSKEKGSDSRRTPMKRLIYFLSCVNPNNYLSNPHFR